VPHMLSQMLDPSQDLMLPFLEDNNQLNAAVLKATMVAVVYLVLLVNTVATVHLDYSVAQEQLV
jgi:hypothetical protein